VNGPSAELHNPSYYEKTATAKWNFELAILTWAGLGIANLRRGTIPSTIISTVIWGRVSASFYPSLGSSTATLGAL
jgi:hypothetical protein